jgi:hypothetical protein
MVLNCEKKLNMISKLNLNPRIGLWLELDIDQGLNPFCKSFDSEVFIYLCIFMAWVR